MTKVLVVEDERPIVDILAYHLEKENFQVVSAGTGPEGLASFSREHPDLVILDLMLPGLDGLAVCRGIRRTSSVPVLMLTAKGEEVDKVVGLEVGADDYVTKPFSTRELIARVRALVRRAHLGPTDHERLTVGELVFDADGATLRVAGRNVDLTPREYALMRLVASRAPQPVRRHEILAGIWGPDFSGGERTVDVTVRRVREKVEVNPASPRYLRTRRGVGYYVDPEARD